MKIQFTCENPAIAEHFPPVPASKMLPEWYKKLPRYTEKLSAKRVFENEENQDLTVKACVPVMDYVQNGYILRASYDIALQPEMFGEEKGWWSSSSEKVLSHPHKQCPVRINNHKNAYIKIVNPWTIKTPPGYSCYFYQPDFFLEERYKLFPAIVDTDTFDTAVNFPGIILSDENLVINAGDPLMAVFPFKRESWEQEITVAETKQTAISLFLEYGYKKLFHKPKSFK